MIDITGTIIDVSKKKLIGLVFTDSTTKETRHLGLMESKPLIRKSKSFGFNDKTNNIEIIDKKLGELDMYNQNNQRIPSGISIIKKIINDEKEAEILGFEVSFACDQQRNYRLKYNEVISLSNIFNPLNFVVRTMSSGKKYIATKGSANKLSEMPYDVIVTPKTQVKEAPKSKTDMMGLMEYLKSQGCIILNMPNNVYNGASVLEKQESGFVPLGETSTPQIIHSENKMNANIKFKKHGLLAVEEQTIYTFTWSEKTLYNSYNIMLQELGIAVPEQLSEEVLAEITKRVNVVYVKNITDKSTRNIMKVTTGSNDYKLIGIQTSDIELMSKTRANQAISTIRGISDLRKLQEQYMADSLTEKAIKAATSELNKSTKPTIAKGLCGYNDQMLEKLSKQGIDLMSGAYTSKSTYAKDLEHKSLSIQFWISSVNLAKLTAKVLLSDESSDLIRNTFKGIISAPIESELIRSCEEIKHALRNKNMKKLKELSEISRTWHDRNKSKLWNYKMALLTINDFKSLRGVVGNWGYLRTNDKSAEDVYECLDNKGFMLSLSSEIRV